MDRLIPKTFRIALASVLWFAVTLAQETEVLGEYGKSVTLQCNLKKSQPPEIVWEDMVFNMNDSPIQIFSSVNNSNFQINPDHSNQQNFKVNKDYSLTASNLQIETGPGRYTCKSTVDGRTSELSYYLNVHAQNLVNCTGNRDLREGDSTTLECSSRYSGNQPTLIWMTGDKEIASKDNFEIRLAKRVLEVNQVTYKNDKQTYTCRMNLGKESRYCYVQLSVKHLVRDLTFTPNTNTLRVGDELRCEANGNPSPQITLSPSTPAEKSANGMRAMVMQKEWVGNEVTIKCEATNSVDGIDETASKTITIKVLDMEAVSSGGLDSTALIIGVAVAIAILVAIVIAVVCIRRRKARKPPKGAKPLPTKDQISQRQNGQHSQAV